jgi:glutathionyl-hydroquinone reductase
MSKTGRHEHHPQIAFRWGDENNSDNDSEYDVPYDDDENDDDYETALSNEIQREFDREFEEIIDENQRQIEAELQRQIDDQIQGALDEQMNNYFEQEMGRRQKDQYDEADVVGMESLYQKLDMLSMQEEYTALYISQSTKIAPDAPSVHEINAQINNVIDGYRAKQEFEKD